MFAWHIKHLICIWCTYAHGMHMFYRGCAQDMQLMWSPYAYDTLCYYMRKWCTVDLPMVCTWYTDHVRMIYNWCAPYAYDTHVICECDALLIFPSYAHVIPRMWAWYAVDARTVSLWNRSQLTKAADQVSIGVLSARCTAYGGSSVLHCALMLRKPLYVCSWW